ncbi:hypothetical protein [Microbacterium gorillae]|uniref:hypothetical protein n=1 Tax=Microbacterium gorillae TaxID=1231063 RepID=UPI00058DA58C|nr:hypothetical protein [Microbacterium gorillae]
MEADRRLAPLIGDWDGTEELFATEWASAGGARGALSVSPIPGGVVVDYVVLRPGEDAFVAHGVLSGEGWWWFDSFGSTPTEPGTAGWQDDLLVLERRSERGRNVMGIAVSGDRLEVRVAFAGPDEAELRPVSSGAYRRR